MFLFCLTINHILVEQLQFTVEERKLFQGFYFLPRRKPEIALSNCAYTLADLTFGCATPKGYTLFIYYTPARHFF